MRLLEFFSVLKENCPGPAGTFVSARLANDTLEQLKNWLPSTGIVNTEDPEKWHITVGGSQETEFPWENSQYDSPIIIDPSRMQWDNSFGDEGNILVLKLDSQELRDRHSQVQSQHNGGWTFPEYSPHLTISYDHGLEDISNLILPDFPLIIDSEYVDSWN